MLDFQVKFIKIISGSNINRQTVPKSDSRRKKGVTVAITGRLQTLKVRLVSSCITSNWF